MALAPAATVPKGCEEGSAPAASGGVGVNVAAASVSDPPDSFTSVIPTVKERAKADEVAAGTPAGAATKTRTGLAAPVSTAPESQPAPAGRGRPRWSLSGHP